MGGNFALTAAGAFPDKFAAVASFHGMRLYMQRTMGEWRDVVADIAAELRRIVACE